MHTSATVEDIIRKERLEFFPALFAARKFSDVQPVSHQSASAKLQSHHLECIVYDGTKMTNPL
jgi:hypothetical protein